MTPAEILSRSADVDAWLSDISIPRGVMSAQDASDILRLTRMVMGGATSRARALAATNAREAEGLLSDCDAIIGSEEWSAVLDGTPVDEAGRFRMWQRLLNLQRRVGERLRVTTRREVPPVPVSTPARSPAPAPASAAREESSSGAGWGVLALLVAIGIGFRRR